MLFLNQATAAWRELGEYFGGENPELDMHLWAFQYCSFLVNSCQNQAVLECALLSFIEISFSSWVLASGPSIVQMLQPHRLKGRKDF
jgi:hypothetical protein